MPPSTTRLCFLRRALVPAGVACLLLAGCAARPAASPPWPRAATTTQSSAPAPDLERSLDPCAERLHNICGLFLQFYLLHHDLPPRLEDLRDLDPAASSDPNYFACPVSHLRYVYNPQSPPMQVAGAAAHLVVYDATPVHDGKHFGILLMPPAGNIPLTARVIALSPSELTTGLPLP